MTPRVYVSAEWRNHNCGAGPRRVVVGDLFSCRRPSQLLSSCNCNIVALSVATGSLLFRAPSAPFLRSPFWQSYGEPRDSGGRLVLSTTPFILLWRRHERRLES